MLSVDLPRPDNAAVAFLGKGLRVPTCSTSSGSDWTAQNLIGRLTPDWLPKGLHVPGLGGRPDADARSLERAGCDLRIC